MKKQRNCAAILLVYRIVARSILVDCSSAYEVLHHENYSKSPDAFGFYDGVQFLQARFCSGSRDKLEICGRSCSRNLLFDCSMSVELASPR